MKALVIIASCLVLAVVLKALDVLTSRKMIRSVGGKANKNSKNIAKFNITDSEDIKSAMDVYKDLAD